MVSRHAAEPPSIRQDGFGTRVIERTANRRFERLTLSPVLASPASEQAIRARAAHLTSLGRDSIARVSRIERKGATLSTLSELPEGVSLSDILAALEFGTLTLSNDEVAELVASVVQAAGRMHETLGTIAHGSLSPAHVVVTRDGSTVFTGAVFGDALQALKQNRELLWREFGLALPVAASAPKFDQRGDVAQLGALILAICHRRSLGRNEFPFRVNDLVKAASLTSDTELDSRLRCWLQNAMQLNGRVVFNSCVDAARKFRRLLPRGSSDEAGALALRTAILQLCGGSGGSLSSAAAPELWYPA
jgi:hypothetical protein